MAGILFTDNKLVLSGYNQHKFTMTGIGGKKKHDELPHQTAVREMLEELFEFVEIPETLIRVIHASLSFDKLICTKNYTTFVMSFQDLDKIFGFIRMVGNLTSRVYDVIPLNIHDLIFLRKIDVGAEFSHLGLIPCSYNISLDRHFIYDIYAFKNCGRYLM